MKRLALLAVAFLVGACAQIELGAPVAGFDNIQKAKAAGIGPVALGSFAIGPGLSPSADQRLSARTNTLFAPEGSSFARYLRATLAADLEAAGLLDPASPVVIEGLLTHNELAVPTGTAHGIVAARFIVKRAGQAVYDKELRAGAQWQASFPAVEAVPSAMNQYGLLHRRLVTQLLDDPDFRAAAKR